MSNIFNIFISHYYQDDNKVQDLKRRLNENQFNVRNFSVDSTKHKDGRIPSKDVIQRYLRMQINRASTLICLIGPNTHTRPWVDFEIREAIKQGKKVIGVFTHGSKNKVEIPEPLKRYGSSIIGWNSIDKLGNIIEGKETIFENPDSTPSGDYFSIQRVC